ncbi:MAG: DUF1572 family protein [Cyclobacteriaceae bacterium]
MDTLKTLNTLFQRDLDKLIVELEAYQGHELWEVKKGIKNSGGNLALHLNGNLQHFIGAVLGETGFVRERDKEFSLKDVPVGDIIKDVEVTKKVIEDTLLNKLETSNLDDIYSVKIRPEEFTVGAFLFHLYGHLSWHLGHINYLRRMIAA